MQTRNTSKRYRRTYINTELITTIINLRLRAVVHAKNAGLIQRTVHISSIIISSYFLGEIIGFLEKL
ncbi:hypothetical protein Hanom_Chr01g00090891 [Helianthus anomalus]